MCMIAHRFLSAKGKGANIPNAVIDTAINRHPDGFGVAWRDDKEGLVYEKFAPQDKAAFRALLKDLDKDQSIEYVAHFRYATHGPEDEAHAHPYEYEDPDPSVGTVLVFHNGVITPVKTTPEESDTEVFVRDVLAKLPSRWWASEGIRLLVDHMGGWSRLVLMTKDETVNLNWGDGNEDQGLWYSSDHTPSTWTSGGTVASAYGHWSSWDNDDEEWVRVDGAWVHNLEKSSPAQTIPYAAVKASSVGHTSAPRSMDAEWMHEGHTLQPLQVFDFGKDGDYEVSVVCDSCGTAGDVYIVDGKAYIDIPHAWNVKEEQSEEEIAAIEAEYERTGTADAHGALLPEPSRKLALVVSASGQDYGLVN